MGVPGTWQARSLTPIQGPSAQARVQARAELASAFSRRGRLGRDIEGTRFVPGKIVLPHHLAGALKVARQPVDIEQWLGVPIGAQFRP